jgi:hypothetical protein
LKRLENANPRLEELGFWRQVRLVKGFLHTKIFCKDAIDLDVLKRKAIKIKKFIERAMKFAKGLNKNGAQVRDPTAMRRFLLNVANLFTTML